MPQPVWLVGQIFSRLGNRHATLFTSHGFRLDDGNPTWTDLSSAAEWLTGKSSSSGARLAHEFGLIRTIE